jgi:hypothetical protein
MYLSVKMMILRLQYESRFHNHSTVQLQYYTLMSLRRTEKGDQDHQRVTISRYLESACSPLTRKATRMYRHRALNTALSEVATRRSSFKITFAVVLPITIAVLIGTPRARSMCRRQSLVFRSSSISIGLHNYTVAHTESIQTIHYLIAFPRAVG